MNVYWASVKKYKNRMFVPNHKHMFHQILFIKSGIYRFTINGEVFIAGKNVVIVVSDSVYHSYTCIDKGSILDFKLEIDDANNVSQDAFLSMYLEGGLELSILNQLYINMIRFSYSENNVIILNKSLELVLSLLKEKRIKVPDLSTPIYAINSKDVINDQVSVIVQYFEKNFLINPQIKDIAKYFNLSVHEMDKLFMNEIGVSPKKLLLSMRLDYAQKKLLTGDYSVTYVANEIDMSLTHFSRIFKIKYGISPKQYKKNYYRSTQVQFNDEFDLTTEPQIINT